MIAANSASSSANDVSIRHCDLGVAGADLAADLDAVAVGQPDVEHGHVGPQRAGCGCSASSAGAGLADDLDVVLGLEQLAQPRRTTSWSSSRNTRIVTAPVCRREAAARGIPWLAGGGMDPLSGPRSGSRDQH